jgi:hypothetical protein
MVNADVGIVGKFTCLLVISMKYENCDFHFGMSDL